MAFFMLPGRKKRKQKKKPTLILCEQGSGGGTGRNTGNKAFFPPLLNHIRMLAARQLQLRDRFLHIFESCARGLRSGWCHRSRSTLRSYRRRLRRRRADNHTVRKRSHHWPTSSGHHVEGEPCVSIPATWLRLAPFVIFQQHQNATRDTLRNINSGP